MSTQYPAHNSVHRRIAPTFDGGLKQALTMTDSFLATDYPTSGGERLDLVIMLRNAYAAGHLAGFAAGSQWLLEDADRKAREASGTMEEHTCQTCGGNCGNCGG